MLEYIYTTGYIIQYYTNFHITLHGISLMQYHSYQCYSNIIIIVIGVKNLLSVAQGAICGGMVSQNFGLSTFLIVNEFVSFNCELNNFFIE